MKQRKTIDGAFLLATDSPLSPKKEFMPTTSWIRNEGKNFTRTPFQMSRELVSAASANVLINVSDALTYVKRFLKPRCRELQDNIQRSRFSNALVMTLSKERQESFLLLYGFFLSQKPSDTEEILSLMDKCCSLRLPTNFFNASESFCDQYVSEHPKYTDHITISCAYLAMLLKDQPAMMPNEYECISYVCDGLLRELCGVMGISLLGEVFISGQSADKYLQRAIHGFFKRGEITYSDAILSVAAMTGSFRTMNKLLSCYSSSITGRYTLARDFSARIKELISDRNQLLSDEAQIFVEKIYKNDCTVLASAYIPQMFNHQREIYRDWKAFSIKSSESKRRKDFDDELEDAPERIIASLEQKLAAEKQERDHLSQKINVLRSQIAAQEKDIQAYQSQLADLNMDFDDDFDSVSMAENSIAEEDLDVLRNLKVVLIGGHERMYRHFLDDGAKWIWIPTKTTIDKNIIESADLVLVISSYIAHSTYFSLKSMEENRPDLQAKTFCTSFKNKDRIYRQILEFLK